MRERVGNKKKNRLNEHYFRIYQTARAERVVHAAWLTGVVTAAALVAVMVVPRGWWVGERG